MLKDGNRKIVSDWLLHILPDKIVLTREGKIGEIANVEIV
jgi:hypothetical protein